MNLKNLFGGGSGLSNLPNQWMGNLPNQWMGGPASHQAMTATQVQLQQQAIAAQLGQAQSQYSNQMMQQMVGAMHHMPNYNDHVPVWDEGGYEPWLGKPAHRPDYCQRCMFL